MGRLNLGAKYGFKYTDPWSMKEQNSTVRTRTTKLKLRMQEQYYNFT